MEMQYSQMAWVHIVSGRSPTFYMMIFKLTIINCEAKLQAKLLITVGLFWAAKYLHLLWQLYSISLYQYVKKHICVNLNIVMRLWFWWIGVYTGWKMVNWILHSFFWMRIISNFIWILDLFRVCNISGLGNQNYFINVHDHTSMSFDCIQILPVAYHFNATIQAKKRSPIEWKFLSNDII